jgi:NAD+ kinase
MVVLIVTKTTNYDLHGAAIEARVAAKRVSDEAIARLKKAHDEHYRTLGGLRAALTAAGVAFEETSRDSAKPWPAQRDAVITVGGDGTLLAATHQMSDGGLVVGLRSSVSSVGYLCGAGPDEVDALVRALVGNKLKTAKVHRLRAELTKIDTGEVVTTEPVLNDFLYTNANPAATTRYRLRVDGADEVHRSSGIWIATAAGSTAAVLAAGGERRAITDTAMQYRVRELYRLGHTVPTLAGGVFDPEADTGAGPALEIENRCPEAILALDGQHGTHGLGYGDRLRFRRAAPIDLGVALGKG